jgi:hypothetical protein
MTGTLKTMCLAAAALLVSAASAFAQERPVSKHDRAELEALGVAPILSRTVDRLADAAEAARARHAAGAREALADANVKRVRTGEDQARPRNDSSIIGLAHIARIIDRKGDRRVREEFEAEELTNNLKRLKSGEFPKDGIQQAVQKENEQNAIEREKRADANKDRKSDPRDLTEKQAEHDELLRQVQEERQQQRQEAAADRKADRDADRKETQQDKKSAP